MDVLPLPHEPTAAQEQLLTQLIEGLYAERRIAPAEEQARAAICAGLEAMFQEEFPAGRLHVFGSSHNGFGQTGSDMDTVFVVPEDAVRAQ